jgi:ribose transport system substrate-binding protein
MPVVAAWPHALGAQVATPAATPEALTTLLDPTAGESGPILAKAPNRLAMLVPFPDDVFWQSIVKVVPARASANGVSVQIVPLSQPSVPEQLAQIADAISQNVDGLLIGPVDAIGIAPGIASLNAAEIPVIALDTPPAGGEVVSIVKTDNVAASAKAGQYLGQLLNGEGTILNIQGDLTNAVAQDRDRGFRDALQEFPEITIISGQGSWTSGGGYTQMAVQLPVAGEGTPAPPAPLVDAAFAASSEMTLGAAQAVENAQADTVTVTGFGATVDTLKEISNGLVRAVVAEYPTRVGVLSIDLMVRHLNGESIPTIVDSGSTIVDRDNLDDFIASGA